MGGGGLNPTRHMTSRAKDGGLGKKLGLMFARFCRILEY
jgi:hypothetical protein